MGCLDVSNSSLNCCLNMCPDFLTVEILQIILKKSVTTEVMSFKDHIERHNVPSGSVLEQELRCFSCR